METSVRLSVPDVAELIVHCTGDVVSNLNVIDAKLTDDPPMMNTAVDDSLTVVSAETVFVTPSDACSGVSV